MTSQKPEWFELTGTDATTPVFRSKSKKFPMVSLLAAGAVILGGSLFANASDEPKADASTSLASTTTANTVSDSTNAPAAPTIGSAGQVTSADDDADGDGDHGYGDDDSQGSDDQSQEVEQDD